MLPTVPEISRYGQAALWSVYSRLAVQGYLAGNGPSPDVANDLTKIESAILAPGYASEKYPGISPGSLANKETKILGRIAYLRSSTPGAFPSAPPQEPAAPPQDYR